MGLFLSTVTNRVDAKGRVSVPARFRAALSEMGVGSEAGPPSIVCFASFTLACIEAMTMDKAEEYAERLDTDFNPFDDEADAFAQSILAACVELPIDKDGRIMLTGSLMDHAGLSAQATFVGLGHRFQIWEPETYEDHALAARQLAHDRRRNFTRRSEGAASEAGTLARVRNAGQDTGRGPGRRGGV